MSLNIAFLWHMHQPPYQRGGVKETLLPWVWLHSLKDYYDMGALLKKHPNITVNINFTPSLLEQINNYVNLIWTDPFFEMVAGDPQDISPSDLIALLNRFINLADGLRQISPAIPQFIEAIKSHRSIADAASGMSSQDILDLQVLFVLAWCGPTLQSTELVQGLLKKQRGYTTDEKKALLDAGLQLMKDLPKLYSELVEQGRVELSYSPFYHPLTPLLWSNHLAKEADPNVQLPNTIMMAKDEVNIHIHQGKQVFRDFFKVEPVGMWPPEGAVADVLVDTFINEGVQWIATDEEILRRSLNGYMGPYEKCSVYKRKDLHIFFRNRDLSDRIGFLYAKWPKEQAVDDFITALKAIDAQTPDNAIVVIAMDGENAWEYYKNGGFEFLDHLYSVIEATEWLKSVSLSDYIKGSPDVKELAHLATGSWINGNLNTWIGDPVKNKAWEYLSEAYKAYQQARLDSEDKAEAAHPYLLRAEASDWFWWFGEGHSSPDEPQFDLIFRENLMAVYKSLGLNVPEYLQSPLEEVESIEPARLPSSYINPQITGKTDTYYKWTGAGCYRVSQGSIHRIKPLISRLFFGFNPDYLFFKVEPAKKGNHFIDDRTVIQLIVERPKRKVFDIKLVDGQLVIVDPVNNTVVADSKVAYEECLEFKIPVLEIIGDKTGKHIVEFFIVILEDGLEVERVPWSFNLSFEYNPVDFDLENWMV